jgi:hypothetical protein
VGLFAQQCGERPSSIFARGWWAENTLRQSRTLFLFCNSGCGDVEGFETGKKIFWYHLLTCYREEPWECAIVCVAFVMLRRGLEIKLRDMVRVHVNLSRQNPDGLVCACVCAAHDVQTLLDMVHSVPCTCIHST